MDGETTSEWIFGLLMALLGVLGLIMAGGARDTEILVFGVSLAGFSLAFIGGLIRRRVGARSAAVREPKPHV
jgi:hypothetical protein